MCVWLCAFVFVCVVCMHVSVSIVLHERKSERDRGRCSKDNRRCLQKGDVGKPYPAVDAAGQPPPCVEYGAQHCDPIEQLRAKSLIWPLSRSPWTASL